MKRMRSGFTVLELVFALGMMATAMALVAELVAWGLLERLRSSVHQEAIEAAANIMEEARNCPWEALDKDWAGTRKLPAALAERRPEPRLLVQIVDDPSSLPLKRVTVSIEIDKLPTVRLTGLFAPRSHTGGKP